jgi:hypothetical protein
MGRPVEPPVRVEVFIAGVQKCGTTSLYAYFKEHPQLAAPRMKETHFFDNEELDWRSIDYRALDELYEPFLEPNGKGRVRFDATPIYIYWPESLARIKRYNADAKLIFLFRDPIERAYSHWRMERARGTEQLAFPAAIRVGRKRQHPGNRADPSWRDHSYVERGLYGEQLTRALSLFPRRQMLFLESTRLRSAHAQVLASVARFLGIEPFPACGPKHEREAPLSPRLPPMASDDCAYLQTLFADDLQLFAKLSGIDVANWPTMQGGSVA